MVFLKQEKEVSFGKLGDGYDTEVLGWTWDEQFKDLSKVL